MQLHGAHLGTTVGVPRPFHSNAIPTPVHPGCRELAVLSSVQPWVGDIQVCVIFLQKVGAGGEAILGPELGQGTVSDVLGRPFWL